MTRRDDLRATTAGARIPAAPAVVADAVMRSNLYFFLVGAFPILSPGDRLDRAEYLEALCYALQDVAAGRERRLLVSIAPRHLKSLVASVLLPAFLLGQDPTRKIMVVSYGGELAREQALAFERLVTSDLYRRLFPLTRFKPRARPDMMKTSAGGQRQAGSVGGGLTGFGADVLILDDLMKTQDVHSETLRASLRLFFDQTVYSRLNDKRAGAIVAVQQRLHLDDITGYLLEKGSFHHLCLPSIATRAEALPLYGKRSWRREVGDVLNPAREPREVLDQIRSEIGAQAFEAQYQQDPRAAPGQYLRIEDLTLVPTLPAESGFTRRTQSWDLAAHDGPRCDYSAGLTFGWHEAEERWYLLDVVRARLDYTALKDRVLAERKRWRADRVLIETGGVGHGLLSEMRKTADRVYLSVTPVTGKVERFITQTDWIMAGNLVIPTDAPWFDNFRRELLAFPNDRHDDQVDALTQWVCWMRRVQGTYLDTNPETGRRRGEWRPTRPRPEDRMRF